LWVRATEGSATLFEGREGSGVDVFVWEGHGDAIDLVNLLADFGCEEIVVGRRGRLGVGRCSSLFHNVTLFIGGFEI
jgi:hypothetical protein